MKPIPLSYRVALGYGLTGLLLSAAFAVATTFIADDYEDIFVASLVQGEADTYLEKLRDNPAMALPNSPGFGIYREQDAPKEARGLALGIHEMDLDGSEGVHVGVFAGHGRRLVIVLDVGQIEELEIYLNRLMVVVVLGGTLFSAWLGWLFAERAIRPVARLAQAVEALPVRPIVSSLAADYPRDGVGTLAAAVDRYQQRLVDADVKEREFFADASHELRTPLSVIQGAVEVFKDDPGLDASHRARLDRIDRNAAELGLLLDAVLLSARGVPADRETLDLRQLCEQALTALAAKDDSVRSRVRIVGPELVPFQAPRRWATCIIDVLFKRALLGSNGTHWQLQLGNSGLSLSQFPLAQAESEAIRRSDLGLGFVFVDRLCRGLGWTLEQRLTEESGLAITLSLSTAAEPGRRDGA